MKFCAKCGMQLLDEAIVCPQCSTPTDNQIKKKTKQHVRKKFNIMYILVPLIIITFVMNVFTITFFVLPNYNSENGLSFSSTVNNTCPADKYGHHSWSPAKCTNPSHCYNCGAYKDNKLGNHDFNLDDETGLIVCWNCNMLKDDYDNK